jgi:hypothetical protein
MDTNVFETHSASIFRLKDVDHFLGGRNTPSSEGKIKFYLKMEVAGSSESLVPTYKITRHHMAEDRNLNAAYEFC